MSGSIGSPRTESTHYERERIVAVQVFDEFADGVCDSWLERVCLAVLEQEGISQHVSLVIADDETVRLLNAEYRGLDKTTDVLSFAFDNEGEYYGEGDAPSDWSASEDFVLPPGESAGLGEVIVSYPQAVRQAQEAGRSVERELARLITHGILHLMGHDHMDDDEEAVMTKKELTLMEGIKGIFSPPSSAFAGAGSNLPLSRGKGQNASHQEM